MKLFKQFKKKNPIGVLYCIITSYIYWNVSNEMYKGISFRDRMFGQHAYIFYYYLLYFH